MLFFLFIHVGHSNTDSNRLVLQHVANNAVAAFVHVKQITSCSLKGSFPALVPNVPPKLSLRKTLLINDK